MLPKYLRTAIYNWKDYLGREYLSAKDEWYRIQKEKEEGKITEEEFMRMVNILNFRYEIDNEKAGFLRNDRQDFYRYKIREKLRKGLIDLTLVLENLNAISPDAKQGKPLIDPQLMDEICMVWLGLTRKKQWALKEGKNGNKFYSPPKFPLEHL